MTMTDRYYQAPSWFRTRLLNPVFRTLVLRAGLGRRGEQNIMRVLRVRGRRSGRLYEVPVRIAAWNGHRYIVSVQGESQWARNLRAAGAAELLVGTRVEPVAANEIRADEKAAFLAWYCRQPEHRLSVRYGFKADAGSLSPAELDRVAHQYPIFRLEAAGALAHGEQKDAPRQASL
jgi:deazaflavin-dependent oxidoreductase (nitroreductase family)